MSSEDTSARPPLNRERILRAAIDVADQQGLGALTMRRLGAELGVEAMSLYKHVANKDAILDGILEVVIGEIEVPDEDTDWREAMRRRAHSARHVLLRHSWAIGLLEERGATSSATQGYVNAIIGSLRSGGFSIEKAAYAFWLLDSFVYGHVVQEAGEHRRAAAETANSRAEESHPSLGEEYPHLAELERHAQEFDYSMDEMFAFGLGLILDALEGATVS